MLKVYSASAGSGKTFRLAKEYIKLLFRHEYAYRNILAVTFTNKATEEMKSRILEQLNVLASCPEKSPYYEDIASACGFSAKETAETARNVLERIMNDYTAFSVSTIDRFFQRTMRAFARELGLYGSYSVDLDRMAVYSEGIDDVVDSIGGDSTDPALIGWLVEMAMDSFERGGKWNVKDFLKNSGTEIFSEEFRIKSGGVPYDRALPKKSIALVRERCGRIMGDFEQGMSGYASRALSVISEGMLAPEDFIGGGRSPFRKLRDIAEGKLFEIPDSLTARIDASSEAWYARTSAFKDRISAVYPSLNDCLHEMKVYYEDNHVLYNTAVAVSSELLRLGVVSDIASAIASILRERNTVMLDDTNQALAGIISDDDTPFVYEKLGTRYDDYLLDEFQDTSRLQWHNFLPLVSNSVSQGGETLVVGDVKQSIYRWRSGDWRIMGGEIKERFPDALFESMKENWRSLGNIVSFNNDFFSFAVERCGSSMLSEVYADIRQEVPSLRAQKAEGGHVHIRFLSKDDDVSSADECLLSSISRLRANGYVFSDITLLVRSNSDGERAVELLKNNGIPVISDDSLLVGNSFAVKYVINTLRKTAPGDMPAMSLYAFCEACVAELPEETMAPDTAHVYAFLDKVNEFVSSEGDDPHGFLSWWETFSQSFTVPAPENDYAVRVMTVHKSKGLDFKAVIVPYLEVPMYKASKRWVRLPEDDFGTGLLVPVVLNSKSEKTLFADDYREEAELSIVDNFNIAYVAFTRGVEELVIICDPLSKAFMSNPSEPSRISEYLYAFCRENRGEGMSFDFGDWMRASSGNRQNKTENAIVPYFRPLSFGNRLKLAYDSFDYFTDAPQRRGRGKILHTIMSRIKSVGDIEGSLSRSVMEGDISLAEMPEYLEEINSAVSSVEKYGWFTGKYDVLTEIEIIEPGGRISRPDRVLVSGNEAVAIDYKFGRQEAGHERQIRRYMSLLSSMGYLRVKGFLWYVEQGHILGFE